MQQELQFTLFIIGIAVIGGVLLHGMWTIRKNAKQSKKGNMSVRDYEPTISMKNDDSSPYIDSGEYDEETDTFYDDVGVGKARVVVSETSPKSSKQSNAKQSYERTAPSTDDGKFNSTNEEGQNGLIDQAVSATETDNNADILGDDDRRTSKVNVFFDEDEELDSPLGKVQQATDAGIETSIQNQDEHKQYKDDVKSDITTNLGDEIDSNVLMFNAERHQEAMREKRESDPLSYEENHTFVPSDNGDDKPVYSNVVTQPKPEFKKAKYGKDYSKESEGIEQFGKPPEFLLNKKTESSSDDQDSVDGAGAKVSGPDTGQPTMNEGSTGSQNSFKPSEDRSGSVETTKKEVAEPEFTLNIQENAPEKKTQNKAEDVPKPQKPVVEKELSFAERTKRVFSRRGRKTVAEKIRKEPVMENTNADDQMRIDFDDSASQSAFGTSTTTTDSNATKATNEASQNAQSEPAASDVLVLNIRARNDKPIEGAALLPMLLTLGFKFGEHDIFHRHVNTNGKGPVLFSLTNMFKPGVFDIDNMENFDTYGIALFMMLPIEGDAQQVFNMMHNAARKLADEFDCQILDGNKSTLSKQSLQQYVERIREFERKRINR